MNIFMTHPSPVQSARWLDDVRVNKMFIESCQLLSTAIRIISNDDLTICDGIYKPTHKNHGCAIWVRTARDNYTWVVQHARELYRLYHKKSNRVHACLAILDRLEPLAYIIPDGSTEPYNGARNKEHKVDYTDERNVYTAYRKYLTARWKLDRRTPTWVEREVPFWIATYDNDANI